MSTRIGVTTPEIRTIANELENVLGEYDRVVANVKTHADDIDGKWRGEAQVQFVRQMEEADAYLKELRALIQTYIVFLRTTAQKYDSTDQEAAAIVQRLNV